MRFEGVITYEIKHIIWFGRYPFIHWWTSKKLDILKLLIEIKVDIFSEYTHNVEIEDCGLIIENSRRQI
jgi:hypothetical protein